MSVKAYMDVLKVQHCQLQYFKRERKKNKYFTFKILLYKSFLLYILIFLIF